MPSAPDLSSDDFTYHPSSPSLHCEPLADEFSRNPEQDAFLTSDDDDGDGERELPSVSDVDDDGNETIIESVPSDGRPVITGALGK